MQGRISSLAVSLALAFFLWLSLAGQDTSLLDLTVGLQLHSLPEHLSIKGEPPKEVTLLIRANAAQVRFLSDRKLSLPLDLSQAQEGYNVFPVLLDPLQLPRGVEVSGVNPEKIEFEALYLPQKEVPVRPNLEGEPDPLFRLEGLVLEPESVTIEGPPEALAQVDYLETTPMSVDGLTQDATFTVNLVLPPEGAVTVIGPTEIQALANIAEIRTQAVFSDIPVEIETGNRPYGRHRGPGRQPSGEPDSPAGDETASFIARPARVRITISWPSSRSQPVNADEVRALVSLDGEQLKAEGRITVPVVAVPPAGATVTAINPATVDISYVPAKAGKP